MIRILLVDDHPVVLGGLERALDSIPDMQVVGQAATLAAARIELERQDLDVALVDIRLPDGVGTTLIPETLERHRPAILLLSSFDHPPYVAAAVRMGAQGFLLKTAPLDHILTAIRRVAAGETAFTADQLRAAQGHDVFLTPRERSILSLVTSSRSNDEIANQLGISRKTVEAYLTRLFARFGALSRTELALRADREGWLEL